MGDDIRLQKLLAMHGCASRRKAQELIDKGCVLINGSAASGPGQRVTPASDVVTVNGKVVPAAPPPTLTILLNKPRGYICSSSPDQGRTVFELLPESHQRLVTVGRLDKDSEGLILLSSDGALVNTMTHPRFDQIKVYRATVSGSMTAQTLLEMQEPMTIDGYTTRPAAVTLVRPTDNRGRAVLEIILKEGRNRQIRRLCARQGLTVKRLSRIRLGDLTVGSLNAGDWREVAESEMAHVRA